MLPVKYEYHLRIKREDIPQQAVKAYMYVSCEVRASSIYKEVKLFQ
jgi:hypothetical protein